MRARRDTPDGPDLPPELDSRDVTDLADRDRIEGAALANLDLSGRQARGLVLEAVTLEAVDLSSARLDRLSLVDVRLTGGSLANVVARGARAVRAELSGARLTGLGLPDVDLRDVVFRACRIDLASFGRARLERVRFEDCVLVEADFTDAQLKNVCFADCDLGRADFRGARTSDCTMEGVSLEGAEGVDRLRGTAMPWPDIVENAGTWAAALGLRVLEP